MCFICACMYVATQLHFNTGANTCSIQCFVHVCAYATTQLQMYIIIWEKFAVKIFVRGVQ